MLDDFLSAIDLSKSRIINYPRYIFLCGGPVPSSTPPSVPRSLRHSLVEKIGIDYPDLQKNIVLAESIFDKFKKMIMVICSHSSAISPAFAPLS